MALVVIDSRLFADISVHTYTPRRATGGRPTFGAWPAPDRVSTVWKITRTMVWIIISESPGVVVKDNGEDKFPEQRSHELHLREHDGDDV
jgi:hypothetical protein